MYACVYIYVSTNIDLLPGAAYENCSRHRYTP